VGRKRAGRKSGSEKEVKGLLEEGQRKEPVMKIPKRLEALVGNSRGNAVKGIGNSVVKGIEEKGTVEENKEEGKEDFGKKIRKKEIDSEERSRMLRNEKILGIMTKEKGKGNEIIEIESSASKSQRHSPEKPMEIKEILFDPDEEEGEEVKKPMEFNTCFIEAPSNEEPLYKLDLKLDSNSEGKARKPEELEGKPMDSKGTCSNKELKINEPPRKGSILQEPYIIFKGRFKFNKSHSKTQIQLLTPCDSELVNRIPQFPLDKKPKLVTSGITNLSHFLRFYFSNPIANKRLMVSGWVEALDPVSMANLRVLAEELFQTEQITGFKFGAKNSASMHFLARKQVEREEALVGFRGLGGLEMMFIITVNGELVLKEERMMEVGKCGFENLAKGLEEGFEKLEEEVRFRKKIEEMLEEGSEIEEVGEEEREEILNMFGRKKRKFR
jgi:hypothetical protein